MFLFQDRIYRDPKGRYFTGEYLDHNGGFEKDMLIWHRCGKSVNMTLDDDIRYEFGSGKIINCNYSQLFRDDESMIICNNIVKDSDAWELESGTEYDEKEDTYVDVYQYFIIDEHIAYALIHHTDEIVWYDERLDLYILGVTHLGTSWDYVCATYKL